MFRPAALCLLVCFLAARSFGSILAYDTASDPAYSSGWSLTDNGGFGFQPWNEDNADGGGTYLESSGRQVASGPSFAIYAGGGGYAVDRPLDNPLSQGSLSLLVRNDESNDYGFVGINLKATPGPLLGSGELLSIGMIPSFGNSDIVVSGSTQQTITPNSPASDLRGDVMDYEVDWDTNAGTYDLTVDDITTGQSASVSGDLDFTGQAVASIGFGNFNNDPGGFQNLIFDQLTVSSVPEPASLCLLGLAATSLLPRRKTRTA